MSSSDTVGSSPLTGTGTALASNEPGGVRSNREANEANEATPPSISPVSRISSASIDTVSVTPVQRSAGNSQVPPWSQSRTGDFVADVRGVKSSPDWRDFVFGGAATWLIGEAHTVSLLAVPAVIALAVARADRRWHAAAATVTGALTTFSLVSPLAPSTPQRPSESLVRSVSLRRILPTAQHPDMVRWQPFRMHKT